MAHSTLVLACLTSRLNPSVCSESNKLVSTRLNFTVFVGRSVLGQPTQYLTTVHLLILINTIKQAVINTLAIYHDEKFT